MALKAGDPAFCLQRKVETETGLFEKEQGEAHARGTIEGIEILLKPISPCASVSPLFGRVVRGEREDLSWKVWRDWPDSGSLCG